MSYCLNPACPDPLNQPDDQMCRACGWQLRLKERYRSLRQIGHGGFGRTFLAVDEDKPSKPRCVIKQLLPQGQASQATAKINALFHREAAQLDELGHHDQIPDLLAYIEQDHHHYVIQSYIDGLNLAQELERSGPFTEMQIQRVLQSLLPVLQFIHRHHVIHRDIKPDNIVRRSSDQELVLVDFGASRSVTGTALERTGTVIGSAEYTAPEQVRGRAVFASDLYSLGVTCIHLLTQMRPFDLHDVAEDQWVWHDYLLQPVSPSLRAILDKLLQRALNRRYQTADQVLQDLQVALSGPGDFTKAQDGPWREPVLILSSTPEPVDEGWTSRAIMAQDKQVATPQLQELPALSPLNYRKLTLFMSIPKVRGAAWSVALSPLADKMAYGLGTRFSFPFKDNSIRVWDLSINQERWMLEGHDDHVLSLAFHPQGQHLVSGSRDETLRLWHVDSERELQTLIGHINAIHQVLYTGTGDGIVSCSADKTIRFWSLQGDCEHVFRCIHAVYAIALNPAADLLASGSSGLLELWDLKHWQKIHQIDYPVKTSKTQVTFSPDGCFLAATCPGYLDLFDLRAGFDPNPVARFQLDPGTEPAKLAYSPDGQLIVVGDARGYLQLWLVSTGRRLAVLPHEGCITDLCFNTDGKMLISSSTKASVHLWVVAD